MLEKILISLTIPLLAACAGAPAAAPTSAPASAPSHDTTDVNTQSAADKRFADEARSYKLVEKNGKRYYCRPERASGSNIMGTICITESELRARVEDEELNHRRSKPSICAPNDPRCGGS